MTNLNTHIINNAQAAIIPAADIAIAIERQEDCKGLVKCDIEI
jgi:5-hydroxyisourate hydrolase-like protein (transthyretin family)